MWLCMVPKRAIKMIFPTFDTAVAETEFQEICPTLKARGMSRGVVAVVFVGMRFRVKDANTDDHRHDMGR